MIFDADTWIGQWPFRSLPMKTAHELLKQMDEHNIDKAMVGSLNGVLYKDVHEANYELIKEIKKHRDRLIPCALINPAYIGWEQDLKQCREEFEMPLIRLLPQYHGYSLSDPCTAELVDAAGKLNMCVSFVGRIVDSRGKHRLDPGKMTDLQEIENVIRAFPDVKFLMLNFSNMPESKIWKQRKCWFDTANFHGGNATLVPKLAKANETDRMVFGSTMLLRYAQGALESFEKAGFTKKQTEDVMYKNLTKILS
jgi:uncharacterized protein